MKKLHLSLFVLMLFSVVYVYGRDLYVDYLDGELDIKSGNSWTPLYMGDMISDSDTIRLDENGYVELMMEDFKITLEKNGIYEVGALISQMEKAGKWGIKGSSLAKLFKDNELESRQSAVMGVRGDPQDEEDITWVDDDVEFLEKGKDLYGKGRYREAVSVLEEGAEWYGSNYDEILFYKALCEYESGQFREMRDSLMGMDPYPDDSFYENYVLLYGNLLIESQDYKKAEEIFNRYLKESVNRNEEQTVFLLSAFCSIQMNDRSGAREKLQKAVNINPGNEAGKKAAEILKSI